MSRLLAWLDDRTGFRGLLHESLYENVPGGSRWRYVWGSTLTFAFVTQVVTGLFLWMCYSPSTQTAWESVYYIEHELSGGWLLRGVHHYTAQAMVVLMALHLAQVVVDGAYRAPREINFWLGLLLMLVVLGLALTGYLLPWDQKGYWATQVATKIAGIVPWVGPQMQSLIVGGSEYGHLTLTRFFALHAGVLPALLVVLLVAHVALFRRHGLTPRDPKRRPDETFWPDQVLKDAVACLAVLVIVVLLSIYWRAELGAPADPSQSYAAARPEWYFLFLFQFLKFFHGETGEVLGAIVIPGLVMGMLFLMPILGRRRLGHAFNVVFLFALLGGAGLLTGLALYEDRQAAWFTGVEYDDLRAAEAAIELDLAERGPESRYHGLDDEARLRAFAENDAAAEALIARLPAWRRYRRSEEFLEAVAAAHRSAERARELASAGVPPTGALQLLRSDAKAQGPRLFARHCGTCHNHVAPEGAATDRNVVCPAPSAPDLYGFGSRAWIAGLLDPEQVAMPHYFGYRDSPFVEGEMVGWVTDTLTDLSPEEEKELKQAVAALSAQAALPAQAELDRAEAAEIAAGEEIIVDVFACTDCHKYGDEGDLGLAPDLTGYASRQWLIDFVSNPAHERFYGTSDDRDPGNDRMPAFAADRDDPQANRLDRESLELIVDWLRGDWYEPASAGEGARPR